MIKTKNPAAVDRSRVPNIKAFGWAFDLQNLTETSFETQSELLAVRAVMRRFPITVHHARVICELAGIGGAA